MTSFDLLRTLIIVIIASVGACFFVRKQTVIPVAVGFFLLYVMTGVMTN